MIEIFFYIFAAMALAGAVGVIGSKSPVGSLLSMVMSLASVAGIYVLLEAHFLAAIQVMVYAGAIMVLFLFVIMLLNLGHEYQKDIRGVVWLGLSAALMGGVAGILSLRFIGTGEDPLLQSLPAAPGIDQAVLEQGAVGAIAEPLFTTYLVPFEITGILLLVAIVGALALAKKRV